MQSVIIVYFKTICRPFDPQYYEDEFEDEEMLDEEGRTRLKLKVLCRAVPCPSLTAQSLGCQFAAQECENVLFSVQLLRRIVCLLRTFEVESLI